MFMFDFYNAIAKVFIVFSSKISLYTFIIVSGFVCFLLFFCTAAKFICLLNICWGRIDKGLEPVSCYQCTFI